MISRRCKVYGYTERLESDTWSKSSIPKDDPSHHMAYRTLGEKGTISSFDPNYPEGGIIVELDKGGYVTVHPKQLRLLKKKIK